MVIDAHVHFWKYNQTRLDWIDNSMKMLKKDHLPAHLQPTLSRNGVDAVVAVQAEQAEVETLFLHELAQSNSFIKAVVGWVDLRGDNIAERLEYFRQFPIIKGFRHVLQDEDSSFFSDAAFRHGLTLLGEAGYTYDLLIYPNQLSAAEDLVRALPGLVFVLDHGAKPAIDKNEIQEWQAGIENLAALPNVYCKLSGLFTEAEWKSWSPGDFYPYLDVLFRAFGTERLLFGSDWPVMLLSGIYVQWKSLLEKYMENHLPEEREAVFGLNARTVYNF